MKKDRYFESEKANELWDEYFNEVDQYLASAPDDHAISIRNELESHVFESVQTQSEGSEFEKLQIALHKLGAPKDIVPPMITEAAQRNEKDKNGIEFSIKTLPLQVAHSFIVALRSVAILVSAVFCLTMFVIACLKPFMPNNVGLFTRTGDEGLEELAFGLFWQTEHMQEQLGLGFIPVALVISFIFFKLCVTLLRNQS